MSSRRGLKEEMDRELERLRQIAADIVADAAADVNEATAKKEDDFEVEFKRFIERGLAAQAAVDADIYRSGDTFTIPGTDWKASWDGAALRSGPPSTSDEDRRLVARLRGQIEDLEAIVAEMDNALKSVGHPLTASLVATTLAGLKMTAEQVAKRIAPQAISAASATYTMNSAGSVANAVIGGIADTHV